jgi:hypothetical protein
LEFFISHFNYYFWLVILFGQYNIKCFLNGQMPFWLSKCHVAFKQWPPKFNHLAFKHWPSKLCHVTFKHWPSRLCHVAFKHWPSRLCHVDRT